MAQRIEQIIDGTVKPGQPDIFLNSPAQVDRSYREKIAFARSSLSNSEWSLCLVIGWWLFLRKVRFRLQCQHFFIILSDSSFLLWQSNAVSSMLGEGVETVSIGMTSFKLSASWISSSAQRKTTHAANTIKWRQTTVIMFMIRKANSQSLKHWSAWSHPLQHFIKDSYMALIRKQKISWNVLKNNGCYEISWVFNKIPKEKKLNIHSHTH